MGINLLSGNLKEMPKWQLVERVVAILEQSLSPDAEVKHNVWLPNIRTGRLRQCDVVIYSGSKYRRTSTIVEVQDRNEKVGPGTFDSWVKKRDNLGAQHLICVSVAGYTEPVHEDAATMGDAVRLMILVEPGENPPFLAIRSIELQHNDVVQREFRVSTEAGSFPDDVIEKIIDTMSSLSFSSSDPLFTDDESSEPFSLDVVLQEMERLNLQTNMQITPIGDGEEERRYILEFPPDQRPLWMRVDDYLVPVNSASVKDRVVMNEMTVPFQILAYEQRNINGAIAWIAPALAKLRSKDLAINLIFLPQDNEQLKIEIQTQLINR